MMFPQIMPSDRLLCAFVSLVSLASMRVIACADESSFIPNGRFNSGAES